MKYGMSATQLRMKPVARILVALKIIKLKLSYHLYDSGLAAIPITCLRYPSLPPVGSGAWISLHAALLQLPTPMAVPTVWNTLFNIPASLAAAAE